MHPRVRPQHGLVALGIVCGSLGVQHLLFEGEGFGTAIESFIILSMTGLIFYTVYELPERDLSAANQWRALKVGVGTAVSFAALATAIWVTWWVEGNAAELSFLLSFSSNLGALMGLRASLYSAEAEERLSEAEELTKLLSINQRVLRHNIRNELSVALGYLEMLESAETSEEIDENVRIIREHLEALVQTSNRTQRFFSIWQTDAPQEFDISELIREQVSKMREETPEVAISTELPDSCRVMAHPALPLAFVEALRNAIAHNTDDVELTVRVVPVDDERVRVLITDTGEGIPQTEREILENARETPLEHTEGVGLWMIYWIVTRSGGTVEFCEREPQGTTIRIELPREGGIETAWSHRAAEASNDEIPFESE